jgi:hypothetical protein
MPEFQTQISTQRTPSKKPLIENTLKHPPPLIHTREDPSLYTSYTALLAVAKIEAVVVEPVASATFSVVGEPEAAPPLSSLVVDFGSSKAGMGFREGTLIDGRAAAALFILLLV